MGECETLTKIDINGRLLNARWQQTYNVNFHCLRSSEYAHITENNVFYLVSLLLQTSVLPFKTKLGYVLFSEAFMTTVFARNFTGFAQCIY